MRIVVIVGGLLLISLCVPAQNLDRCAREAKLNSDGTSTVVLGGRSKVTEEEIAMWMATNVPTYQYAHDFTYRSMNGKTYVTSFKMVAQKGGTAFNRTLQKREEQDRRVEERQNAGAALIIGGVLKAGQYVCESYKRSNTDRSYSSNYAPSANTENTSSNSANNSTNCKWSLVSQDAGRSEFENEKKEFKVVLWKKISESSLNGQAHYEITGTSYVGGLNGRYYFDDGDVYTNDGLGKKIGYAATLSEAIILLLKDKYCQ